MRTLAASLTVAALLAASSCAMSHREPRAREVGGTDRKLSTFAFIEEGKLVSLIVDTRPTRYRADAPYIPVEISIANRGLKSLSLTRESFTLVDETGKRYPVIEPRELMDKYEMLDLDRNLVELRHLVYNRFATFTYYPSQFSPTRKIAMDGSSSLVTDRVSLPQFGYVLDMIYFQKPDTGLMDHRFELWMNAPELPDPVFVKFAVR